jgi:dienelactone hydrolase
MGDADQERRTALLVIAPRGWCAAVELRARAAAFVVYELALEDLPTADRAALAELDRAFVALRARTDVDPARISALGCARGGTLAFLLGCTARGLASAAALGGALVYPRLSAERPIQPLELALNLGNSFHGFHGDADPEFTAADLAEARAKLAQFARDATFHAQPGAGAGWHDPTHSGYRPAALAAALERALAELAAAEA